jgi:hypothetical protein
MTTRPDPTPPPVERALEFAGYLADAADAYIDFLGSQESEIDHDARSDLFKGLRSAVYEFRKRATFTPPVERAETDNAAILKALRRTDPPPPTDVQELQTSPREATLKEVQAALKGVGPPLGLDVANRRIERAQDIIAEALAAAPQEPGEAALTLARFAQVNGYDTFTWRGSVRAEGEEQERFAVTAKLSIEPSSPPGRTGEREAVEFIIRERLSGPSMSSRAAHDDDIRLAVDEILAALTPPAGWKPTHRHADGDEYRFIRHIDGRADGHEPWSAGVLYERSDGRQWWTGNDRWFDRFVALPAPPPPEPAGGA